jgi:hypothetical protein
MRGREEVGEERRGKTCPNQSRPRYGDWLILRRRKVVDHGRVPDEGRKCVALDVGPPLPCVNVWVSCADVFRLEAFEFLLGAKLVGLEPSQKREYC